MMKMIFEMNLNLFIMMLISMMILLIPMNLFFMHPIVLGILLLLLSILNSLNLSIYMNNSWFSFLIYLIIVGGLLILFLYFTSFIMNLKIIYNMFDLMIMFYKFLLINILILIFKYLYINLFMNIYNFNEIDNLINNFNFNFNFNNNLISLMFMYNEPMNYITLFLMMFLFFCMTTIAKICLKNKKSIRKMN